jgi:hypothetical protein
MHGKIEYFLLNLKLEILSNIQNKSRMVICGAEEIEFVLSILETLR